MRDREVLAAVRESGGDHRRPSPETEIAPAVRLLARHGLYTEPTGAIVIAALPRLSIDPRETTVTVLTGSGLKSAATMARILG